MIISSSWSVTTHLLASDAKKNNSYTQNIRLKQHEPRNCFILFQIVSCYKCAAVKQQTHSLSVISLSHMWVQHVRLANVDKLLYPDKMKDD